ncbi:hypothetical protein KKD19_03765 [Patescibacteria group bacterium]|nr:hypothetical protein [Patescibacteria group bacterium]MBU4512328.1 hypothetical protein [Patescibacteria group bacterium]MCG2692550.1 hypothetical protein [Candidatus Parcubacteria bacterium]
MNPDTFRSNFTEIQEKITTKQPKKSNKTAFWLFLCLGLIIIVGLGFFGVKILLQYQQEEPAEAKIPKQVLFYANLDFSAKTRAGKGFQGWINTDLARKNLFSWFFNEIDKRLAGDNQGLSKTLSLFEEEISIVGIDVDNEPEIVILGKTNKNLESLGGISESGPKLVENKLYQATHNGYLILSSNNKALEEIMDPRIDFVFPNGFLKDFFDKSFLKLYFNPLAENSFLGQFAGIFGEIKGLEAQADPAKVVFTIDTPLIRHGLPKADKNELDLDSWLRFITPDTDLALFSNNLVGLGFKTQPNFDTFRIQWEKLYNFDFFQDILALISTQGLIISRSAGKSFDFKTQDYLLVLRNSSNLSENSSEIKKIEEIAKKIMAFQLPQEQKTFLPDNTEIVEIVANPLIFHFETENLANFKLKYLKSEQINFEFAYGFFEDKIVFSNSLNFLKQKIEQDQKYWDFLALINDCFNQPDLKIQSSDFLYINLGAEVKKEYGVRQILGTNQKICVY